MMNVLVREATLDDYEALCEIYSELDTLHRENHPELFIKPDDYARAREYIDEMIKGRDRALFVAIMDAIVVGFAECYILESSSFPVIKKREWVQLDGIAVKKEYHKNRIGSLLFQKVVQWAESRDINRIELKVYSFNRNAVEFYLKQGFKELNKTLYFEQWNNGSVV